MDWICIVIVVAFLICVIVGWAQGLFKVLVSVAGLIASMIAAFYIAPHISGYLEEHTKIDDNIAVYLSEKLHFENVEEEASKGMQVEIIQGLPVSETLKSNILDNNNSEMYEALEAIGVYDYIAKSIAVVIMNAVVFISLVIVVRVFFITLSKIVDGITKLPIVRSIDKIGGGLLGGMKGLIFIWFFFVVLSITSTSEVSQEFIYSINHFPILKLLYDNNLLLDIVGDLTRVLFL